MAPVEIRLKNSCYIRSLMKRWWADNKVKYANVASIACRLLSASLSMQID